jgi:hypothetical protein
MKKMADNGRLMVQQRMLTIFFLCFVERKSAVDMQRLFHAHFGRQWAPAPETIHRLHQQLLQDHTVLEK